MAELSPPSPPDRKRGQKRPLDRASDKVQSKRRNLFPDMTQRGATTSDDEARDDLAYASDSSSVSYDAKQGSTTKSAESAEQSGEGMGHSYCCKCRTKTKCTNRRKAKAKNGRHMIKSTCATCGHNKSCFVKGQSGEGFFDDALRIVGDASKFYKKGRMLV